MSDDSLIWEAYNNVLKPIPKYNNVLKPIPNSPYGNNVYKMNVEDDEFIHFTGLDSALKIKEDGVLELEPKGIKKFGAYSNFAISLKYGKYLPTVQTTHIKAPIIAAVVFKTNDIPYIGRPSEVAWEGDINLINPRIYTKDQGIELLNNTPYKLDTEDDEAIVIYDEQVLLDRNKRLFSDW